MEKKISYLNRTFDDYKQALKDYSKQYYPDLDINYDDASIGSWIIDLNAEIADNLSYHLDRVFQETNINSATKKSSVYALARNSGFKIPGPKGAMAEVKFTATLPVAYGDKQNGTREPDWDYAPTIKRGTKVSSGTQSFELLYDVDFSKQFDDDGNSNRTIVAVRDSNNLIVKYKVSKLAVVVAGDTRVYKQSINSSDIKPFMEVLIPTENVMNVESILIKQGNTLQSTPTYGEFYMPNETSSTYETTTRFFEVDYLAQQYRWAERTGKDGITPVKYEYSYLDEDTNIFYPTYSVTKGEWKPIHNKFITEFTDAGYLKVIFGAGVNPNVDTVDISEAADFSRYQIAKIIKNDSLGYLPDPDTTMFILYRVGGGTASNVAKGSIKTISTLKIEIGCGVTGIDYAKKDAVRASVTVENTTPSVSGKDMPTTQELKYMIKYNNGAQERCVTVKDYIIRTLQMPPKYGTPFRIGGTEDNNKIMLYILGLDYKGKLDATLPAALVENIQDYLAEYRMINDFVEIKSGKIVNISMEADLYFDKNYNQSDVMYAVREVIKDYMDINKHNMGDDIFIGDIEKEISKVDGVINLIDLRVYNEIGNGYSSTQTSQEIVSYDDCTNCDNETYQKDRLKIDLSASDYILYSDGDTMLEIKYPEVDIKINCKQR